MAQVLAAETDGLTGAGAIHDQHGNTALDQVGHTAHVLDFLGDIEAVKINHAGRLLRFGILRMHEITGQGAGRCWNLDDLDFDVGQADMAVETIHAFFVGG